MPRRILEGKVVSDKTDKTVTVLVERRYMHPIYKKYLKQTSKYAAHDANNAFREGDVVQIQECRPLSKTKKWVVISDVPAGRDVQAPAAKPVAEKAAPAAAKKASASAPKKAAPKTTSKAKKAE